MTDTRAPIDSAPIDPAPVVLSRGSHTSPSEGMCLVEYAAWLAGEPHSAHPECVSVVVGEFCRVLNDTVADEERTGLLVGYGPLIVGTNAGLDTESRRAWMALDWLVRTCLPGLARAGRRPQVAAALAELPRLDPQSDIDGIWSALDAIRGRLPAQEVVADDEELPDTETNIAERAGFDAAWAASAMAAWWAWDHDLDECVVEAIRSTAFDIYSRFAVLISATGAAPGDNRELAGLRTSALDLLARMVAVSRRLDPAVAERIAHLPTAA